MSVVDRMLGILDVVRVSDGAATITGIARETGLPKSTASRLVAELVRQRYLTRTESGVGIGLRLFELGTRASMPRRLSAAAMPVLAQLFNATGEHINVAVQDGSQMLSVVAVRGRLSPAPSRAGVRVPAATTALGKAVLAFSGDDSLMSSIATGFDATARRSFEQELADVRVSAVAIDRGVTFPGVVGVASPVLSRDRRPVAAISVAGPAADMDPDRIMPLVRHAAVAVTRRLAQVA